MTDEAEKPAATATDTKPTVNNDDARCTCKSEYCVEPCPVHGEGFKKSEKGEYIISDEQLVDEVVRTWTGHVFICTSCNEESIMHFNRHCPNCGVPVLIQSKSLTEYIRARTLNKK